MSKDYSALYAALRAADNRDTDTYRAANKMLRLAVLEWLLDNDVFETVRDALKETLIVRLARRRARVHALDAEMIAELTGVKEE